MHAPLKRALLPSLVVTAAAAPAPETLLSDTRLTVHTLLREEFSPASGTTTSSAWQERNDIDVLLKERPGERGNLLAWRAGASTFRAVRAHEAGKAEEFERVYAEARADFAAAAKGDIRKRGCRRHHRGDAGHLRGSAARETPRGGVGAGLRQLLDVVEAAGRDDRKDAGSLQGRSPRRTDAVGATNRTQRRSGAVPREDGDVVADTPYEPLAKQWKADPSSAATTNLTCKNCHAPGRLSNRLEALKQ